MVNGEVFVGGEGFSVAPSLQEKFIKEETKRRRSRRTRRVSPSVSVKGGQVFIGGQGFSVAPSLQEQFIKERTGGISLAVKQAIERETARQEELRRQREIRLREEQRRILEEKRRKIFEIERQKENFLVKKFREEEEQKKILKFEEDNIKREIQRLDKLRFQAKNKEQLDKVVKAKLEKEKELRLLKSGITAYNRKVDIEVKRATDEFNKFVNNEVRKLQAQVDEGKISPNVANRILEVKAKNKEKEINTKLNKNISKIKVPEALKESVGVVRAVEPPKGLLEKGISELEKIRTPTIKKDQRAIKESLEGLKELGIGVALGGLSFVKGVKDLPKTLITLIKNPSLIKQIPSGIKREFTFIGESLKISPTRSVARIGTELFLIKGTGRVLKVLGKVAQSSKAKFLTQLSKAGKLKKFSVRFVGGKFPKIELRLKDVTKGFDDLKITKSINKDVSKLIPKTIPKAKVVNINQLSKSIIKSYLKDRRVIAELIRKFPKKTRFKFRDFQKIRSYARLKTKIKQDVFTKFKVKAIRKVRPKVKKRKREIAGVKVRRKEFKSFQEANLEFIKIKRIGKFVKKIKVKGGIGKMESLPRRPLTKGELEFFKIGRKIPKQLLKKVKSASVTTFIQKFSAEIPIIKRFGDLKKGFWRVVFKEKTFYQNSVSFSLFNKAGKPLGTITFNTLASKPITRFRSLVSALKWGTNKEIVLSKLVGKNFVRSFALKSKGRKVTITEFLSKIKVTNKGKLQDILIVTKKIPIVSPRGLKKRFKRAIPVSRTKARITKVKQKVISRFDKKNKVFEIIQRGKTIQKIRTRSIINPVIIDTSFIENIIRAINKINQKALSKARLKRLKQNKLLILSVKKTRSFIINKKPKVIISKARLKQIKKVSTEMRSLKESLAGRTIPPKIRIVKRLEGIKQLKQLKKAEANLRKVRIQLVKRKALNIGSKTAIATSLLLIDKLKKDLKKGKVILTDQATKAIQKKIQKSVQASKVKNVVKAISLIKIVFPMLILLPRALKIIPRVPKIKPPVIIRKKKEEKLEKKIRRFSKPVKIFNVVVKRRGRKVILKNRLEKTDALNFMALYVDGKGVRSSKLEQTGTSKITRRLPKKYNGAWNRLKSKFRKFKIRKRKKLEIRGFIEKKRFALDKKGERVRLKRKPVKRKVIKRKPVKRKPVKRKPVKRKLIKKKTRARKRKK